MRTEEQKQYECLKYIIFFHETLVPLHPTLQRAPKCRSQADLVKRKAHSATAQTQDHKKFSRLGSSSKCALEFVIPCSAYHFLPIPINFDVLLDCGCCKFVQTNLTSRPFKLAWSHALPAATKAVGPRLRRGRLIAPLRKRPSLGLKTRSARELCSSPINDF